MKEKNNIKKVSWDLMVKHLVDKASAEETKEVNKWLESSEENQADFKKTGQMLDNINHYYQAKKYNPVVAWNNVHSKINPLQITDIQHKKKRKEVAAKFYKYAAIIVIAMLMGSITYFTINQNIISTKMESVTVQNQVSETELPDGSLVTLNENSRIFYPKKFKSDAREITLVGEAFFDIKPNAEKPFVINAGNTQIKVLGTSFNVSAYPQNEKVEVVVKTGKVELIRKNKQNTTLSHVFLSPGEKGTFFNANNKLEKVINSDPNYLAWKTHDLIFNETPLYEVINCLEKAYHVSIQLETDSLKSQLYTAHFDKKPIDFVLNVIQMSFNLDVSVDNEQITLNSIN